LVSGLGRFKMVKHKIEQAGDDSSIKVSSPISIQLQARSKVWIEVRLRTRHQLWSQIRFQVKDDLKW
jgi:hypothetical protein